MWMILSWDVDDFVLGCGYFCNQAKTHTQQSFYGDF
jgi:hypothetical protein